MDRRQALSRVALIFGGSIIGAKAFLSGCKSDKKEELFETDEIAMFDEIGETILPTTTSAPGAKAAGIGTFMKVYVSDCYTEKDQQIFKEGFAKIDEASQKSYDKNFMELSPDEKTNILVAIDKEATMHKKNLKPDEPNHFFSMMKQLTIFGYFTSEVGATKSLRYDPVPGSYEGCVDYEKGQRAYQS